MAQTRPLPKTAFLMRSRLDSSTSAPSLTRRRTIRHLSSHHRDGAEDKRVADLGRSGSAPIGLPPALGLPRRYDDALGDRARLPDRGAPSGRDDARAAASR